MTFDLPIAERTLRNTARLVHQSMWLLFVIAAGLMMILRGSVPARTGSIWILGCAVLAFILSFALRDVIKKVGHRNTEDRIVKDVKSFLRNAPADPDSRPKIAAAVSQPAPAGDAFVPSRPADFVPLKGATAYRTSTGDPVVFDAFPSRETVAFNFCAVRMPVSHHC